MIATDTPTEWRSLGACLAADPDLFFPISSAGPAAGQISRAKSICAACPVRQQCLSFALDTGQVHGVWGGTTAEERQSLHRHRRTAPLHHGVRPPDRRPASRA
jgi:WhiB family redox-sensing transcriptional regulator